MSNTCAKGYMILLKTGRHRGWMVILCIELVGMFWDACACSHALMYVHCGRRQDLFCIVLLNLSAGFVFGVYCCSAICQFFLWVTAGTSQLWLLNSDGKSSCNTFIWSCSQLAIFATLSSVGKMAEAEVVKQDGQHVDHCQDQASHLW